MLSRMESKVRAFFDLNICSCIPLLEAQLHKILSTLLWCYAIVFKFIIYCNAFCLFTTVIFEFSFWPKYFTSFVGNPLLLHLSDLHRLKFLWMLFVGNNLFIVLRSFVIYKLMNTSKHFQKCFNLWISCTMKSGSIYFNLLMICYLKLFFHFLFRSAHWKLFTFKKTSDFTLCNF